MRTEAAVIFICALVGCTGTPPKPTSQNAPREVARADDFEKKLKCAGMLDKLRDDAEHDQFKLEAYARTFYSPQLNACLAEKYTLYYPDNKNPEVMEIDDLSSNKTVWSSSVDCKVRETGMGSAPHMEYKCSDYFWNVEQQLEDYVKANHLED